LGRRFSAPNDRSPDENVKRSAHDGQFPQERYLATQGLQSPYSRLQEALTAAGAEPARPEASGAEAPNADLHAAAEPARPGRETGSKLIVGPDIKLKGAEITDCDTLVVEGRVEASMDSRAIQISEHGVFVGKAGIDVAEIRGRFEAS